MHVIIDIKSPFLFNNTNLFNNIGGNPNMMLCILVSLITYKNIF